jgi:hypothetical protein
MATAGDRPYDPYIPSEPAAGGAGGQGAPGNQRTAALQAVSIPSFLRSLILSSKPCGYSGSLVDVLSSCDGIPFLPRTPRLDGTIIDHSTKLPSDQEYDAQCFG